MRLPLVGNISTKDGASNKNARMVNVLAEEKKDKTIAAVRPGLNIAASTSGNGNGMVCFGGELVNVFGATLGVIEPAEPDYTHVISGESSTTIWRIADYVGSTIVGNGGSSGSLTERIYKSDDAGATTSYVADVPYHLGGEMRPDLPDGLINKGGQLYLLSTYSIYDRVYRDNSDYGATWTYVGAPAVYYPCCVDGGNIYSLTVGEVLDDEEEETLGFNVQVHTTTDLTSITASTSSKEILNGNAPIGAGCMSVIDGIIHVIVASLAVLYHFKYQSGSWTYTTQSFQSNESVSTKRCYKIGSKIYFVTANSVTGYTTLRAIDYATDNLETVYPLGAVSVGANSRQLIYNGTTLTICLQFSLSMEYHHFTNLSSYEYNVVTTAALNENATYDFALIP